jgi:hypothetical protein
MQHRSTKASATYSTPGPQTPRQAPPERDVIHSEFVDRRQAERAPGETLAQSLARARERSQSRSPQLAPSTSLGAVALAVGVPALITCAWVMSDERHIVPGEGLGYALGIIGSLMMLALLLYPLRKYSKRLQWAASVQAWFTAHIVLGIIGPALVVVHSNFALNSINATVAMAVMLAVVASGFIGRYIYSRTVLGLSGKKVELNELLDDAAALRLAFGEDMQHAPEIEAELAAYETLAKSYRRSTFGSFCAALSLGTKARRSHALVKTIAAEIISARALREHWDADLHRERLEAAEEHFELYFSAVRWAASLHFFERMFRLWHLFHMPLFLLLIMVVIGHIVAVHLY